LTLEFGVCAKCERDATPPSLQELVTLGPPSTYRFGFFCKRCRNEWTEERLTDQSGRITDYSPTYRPT
jgi:hypothetical protein